jgi:DNA-binding NarL/FixJ family response regulator
MDQITVLIADAEPGTRAMLRDLVGSQADLDLVALAMDADEATELMRLHRPAVAILGARMPCGGAPRALRALCPVSPATGVVVLSSRGDAIPGGLGSATAPIEHVVGGISSPAEIVAAIHRAAGRRCWQPESPTLSIAGAAVSAAGGADQGGEISLK